jgi:hypothetical protein
MDWHFAKPEEFASLRLWFFHVWREPWYPWNNPLMGLHWHHGFRLLGFQFEWMIEEQETIADEHRTLRVW